MLIFISPWNRSGRIEWSGIHKVGYQSDPCTSNVNDLLYRPFVHTFISTAPWTGCSILFVEMSAKSPGFVKYWRRHLNLNVASQPQATREAVSDVPHSRSCTNLSLSNVPLGDSALLAALSIFITGFLLKFSNSPALAAECLVRKPLACLCLRIGSQYPSCLLLLQPLIISQATSVCMPKASQGHVSGSKESCLANCADTSFPSIPMLSGTHISCTVLSFASFTSGWWQSQTQGVTSKRSIICCTEWIISI
jgi:hypothetical protein